MIYPLDSITCPLYNWALDSTEFNLPWEIYSGNLWAHFQVALVQMFLSSQWCHSTSKVVHHLSVGISPKIKFTGKLLTITDNVNFPRRLLISKPSEFVCSILSLLLHHDWVNLAGCISLCSLLNSKVCLNRIIIIPSLFELKYIINFFSSIHTISYKTSFFLLWFLACRLWARAINLSKN